MVSRRRGTLAASGSRRGRRTGDCLHRRHTDSVSRQGVVGTARCWSPFARSLRPVPRSDRVRRWSTECSTRPRSPSRRVFARRSRSEFPPAGSTPTRAESASKAHVLEPGRTQGHWGGDSDIAWPVLGTARSHCFRRKMEWSRNWRAQCARILQGPGIRTS